MLVNLHVKNLALIEEADINYENGLNIMTGETGAGKSIILGSINLALGAKATSDIIRKGADYALTELVFHIEDDLKLAALKELGLEDLDEGNVIISRKIMPARSQIKVNGMNCTMTQVKQVASLLIDIHGQHDNQLLLKENNHLDMIDLFGEDILKDTKARMRKAYKEYSDIKKQLSDMDIDEEARQREISFIEYEINEIESANLIEGEDEELENKFKLMNNSSKIMDELLSASNNLSQSNENAADLVSSALRSLINASGYDSKLEDAAGMLRLAEGYIQDVSREIADYMEDFAFNEEDFNSVMTRVDLINSLKYKYGKTIKDIKEYYQNRQNRLEELKDFDNKLKSLKEELAEKENVLAKLSDTLTKERIKLSKEFCTLVSENLAELNFLNTQFEAEFVKENHFSANGNDKVHFMISTNVGEGLKPLSKVASGGELSRIMLAIKTCLADKDDTETIIFDEIDAGISGRTAQMVANKLNELSRRHQIICITHLPQIAAMADYNYIIEKCVVSGNTVTTINSIDGDSVIEELARLLGGTNITAAVTDNARELKAYADSLK